VDTYETLRQQYLNSEALPSHYWIFISQGMLAWLQAKKTTETSLVPKPSKLTSTIPDSDAIIHILANLVLNVYQSQEVHHVY